MTQSRRLLDFVALRCQLFPIVTAFYVAVLEGIPKGIGEEISPRFIGPFELLEKVGEVAYRLALSPTLSHVHNVFNISILRGYNYHPLHVVEYPLDKTREDLTYEEEAEAILAREERIMRKKMISFVKVL
nr:putative reverse transcriptase domain-containing protein [Tanacetum cinerariifolium]